MEMKLIDNLKNITVENVAGRLISDFGEEILKSAAKYIEEKHNVETEVKSYLQDMKYKRIEFNVIVKRAVKTIGEAVDFLVKYFQKRKEIEEDFDKMVAFYSQIIGEMNAGKFSKSEGKGEDKEAS